MAEPARIGLDNSVFRGRIRRSFPSTGEEAVAARPFSRAAPLTAAPTPAVEIASTPMAENPAPFTEMPTFAAETTPETMPEIPVAVPSEENVRLAQRHIPLRWVLFAMACIVFLVGVVLSVQTMRANRSAAAQIQGLYEQINGRQDNLMRR